LNGHRRPAAARGGVIFGMQTLSGSANYFRATDNEGEALNIVRARNRTDSSVVVFRRKIRWVEKGCLKLRVQRH
jgi:hypothetical protein